MTRKSIAKRGYHHEDLRRALLDAAIAYLRKGDVTGLTIQVLARAAGVSPGAPYHHFPDKVSILAALATEGFALVIEQSRHVVAESVLPREQLRNFASTWLHFAATHPSHYRVMFLPDIEDRARFAELHATSGAGLSLLLEILGRGLPKVSPVALESRAVVVWSLLHGFASLRNGGVLANVPSLPAIGILEKAAIAQVVATAFLPEAIE